MKVRTFAMIAGLAGLLALSVGACSSSSSAPAAARSTSVQQAQTIDPDEAYKANCTRCHQEMPKVSERSTATVMQHMRVRANLTAAETRAIFDYLTQ